MALRAVLVGCGGMAAGWLKALKDTPALAGEVSLVALVDLDLGAAQTLAETFGLKDVAIGSDLEAMLAELKPDILFDVVVPGARHAVVSAGLAAGCHVLSEKPMAVSMDEASDLLRRAASANRMHAIVQNRRYIGGVRRIRRLLDDGGLGAITALHADFFIGAHFGGFRDQMRNPLLLDMAIHTFDAARFMSGKEPRAVYCLETNPAGSWYAHGAAADAIFEMSDGVNFTYRGSWAAEGAPTSWESQWRIIGTRGTLTWDGADRFEANVISGDEGFQRPLAAIEIPPPADADETRGHASVLSAFLRAVRDGRPPETAGADNIRSLGMVFGAIDSAVRRQRVEITV